MNIKQLPTHPLTGRQALGFRKDGRPIWPIAGAAPDGDESGEGGEGGTGDGGGDGSTGLLDDEANNGGGDGEGGDGDNGGGSDGGGNGVSEIVDQVVKALEGRFDSIADKRVNAILKEVRKQEGGQPKGKGKEEEGEGGSTSTGPSDADVREARLVYREYVADEIKFLGNEEREHAMTLAQGLLAGRVAAGSDPETAGREVAKTVATQIKGLRKHYESKTLAALKRKGVIPEDGRGPGQPPAGPSKPGDQSGFKAGAAKASEMFGDRMPQTQQN